MGAVTARVNNRNRAPRTRDAEDRLLMFNAPVLTIDATVESRIANSQIYSMKPCYRSRERGFILFQYTRPVRRIVGLLWIASVSNNGKAFLCPLNGYRNPVDLIFRGQSGLGRGILASPNPHKVAYDLHCGNVRTKIDFQLKLPEHSVWCC